MVKISLKCCCGAAIDVEEDFSPYAQKMATEWQERHIQCKPMPTYAPNPTPLAPYTPTGPLTGTPADPCNPPWIIPRGTKS